MEFYREYTVDRGSGDETLEVAISLDHCATIDDATALGGNVITSCTDPMQVVFSASSSTIPSAELDTLTCELFEDAVYIETVPNGGTASASFQNVEPNMQLPGGWTLVGYTDIQCGMSCSCDCAATSSSSTSGTP